MIGNALEKEAAARKVRGLIRRRDELARRIAQVDHDIAVAGIKYADAAGFRAALRIDSLRREVGL